MTDGEDTGTNDSGTADAVQRLESLRREISAVRQAGRQSAAHVRWQLNTDIELDSMFGPQIFTRQFRALAFKFVGSHTLTVLEDPNQVKFELHQEGFIRDLDMADGILQAAIDQLEKRGLIGIETLRGYQMAPKGRKVFISHGDAGPLLDRVERFVRTLGCDPVIVKHGASQGGAVDDVVEARMAECDAFIILATADDEVTAPSGEVYRQPRANVFHEIGLAQEKNAKRVIYLKESGANFSSNIAPKIWESFTRDDLSPAFEKIAKELLAFGLVSSSSRG